MFHSARIKLTAWYLLIIMLISISFSLVIYRMLSVEVERFAKMQRFRIEQRYRGHVYLDPGTPLPAPPIYDPDLVAETKQRLLFIVFAVNAGIFVLAGGLGYVLAGRTLKPIQMMVDEQNRFITDASHELRTPITALKSSMEVHLRDKNLTLKEARELISGSLDEVNHLQYLAESLLQLAQFQKPNGKLPIEEIPLQKLIREAVQKVKPLAGQKHIEIEEIIDNTNIKGVKQNLKDLFIILLDNAIKYSPENTTITIQSKKTDDTVKISVTDEGIGIDEKDIPNVFDRFYRSDTARTKHETSGYGLGLSIAKQIVTMHKGTISVKSKSGKGSVFTVTFPIKSNIKKKGSFS